MAADASDIVASVTVRPSLESTLRRLLDSRDEAPWTRSRLPVSDDHVDELLECEVLEPCTEGYRLTDPEAVRTALQTRSASESGVGTHSGVRGRIRQVVDERFQWLSRRRSVAVGIALALVAVVRVLPFPAVYRGGDVVLSSNDPYLYRYLVDQVTMAASGPLDLDVLLRFPDGVTSGEPLMVATLAIIAEILGGGPWTTGTLLAWYPVASAVVTGLMVYLVGTHLSDDSRVGLAAVGFFAVVPGHAFRTGLGFADHHAFDYPWLVLTALAFVYLATESSLGDSSTGWWPWRRRTTALAAMLGIGVAGQVLAWDAGPLLVLPLALAVVVYAPFAVYHARVNSLAPIVGGLLFGAVLSLSAHVGLGWQSLVVATVPALLALCALFVSLAAYASDRIGVPAAGLFVVELTGIGVAGVALVSVMPDLFVEIDNGITFLLSSTAIGEMRSLTEQWGPLFGPLIMLGFTPFLALPAMLWSIWDGTVRRSDYGWLLLSCYAWTFLGLSFVQRRFTGELAPFIAVFAGLGFVVLVSKLDLAYGPRFLRERIEGQHHHVSSADRDLAIPGRRRFIMLGGFAAVFAGFPSVFSGAIHGRLTYERQKHAAARWMGTYAAERGWEYPQNYVFSEWGENRMFNYFVNGNSASYWYAQQNYEDFLFSSAPEEWYQELRERAGFVVTTGPESGFVSKRMIDRLHEALGSGVSGISGLAHYRAVYSSPDGSVKAFTLVPGATITGTTTSDESLRVRTEVSIEGATFTYERIVEPSDGEFSVIVPHPGDYQVDDRVVTITERAVTDGETITVS